MSITETATFAAGCFWGVQAAFDTIDGVISTEVGYAGGHKPDATYREVCTGTTGHAEVTRVVFDPTRVSFETLAAAFFKMHDPTTLNRQGPDVGTQYRSAIYPHTLEQRTTAEAVVQRLTEAGAFRNPIVTEITDMPLDQDNYIAAEDYHQKYFEKNGGGCSISL